MDACEAESIATRDTARDDRPSQARNGAMIEHDAHTGADAFDRSEQSLRIARIRSRAGSDVLRCPTSDRSTKRERSNVSWTLVAARLCQATARGTRSGAPQAASKKGGPYTVRLFIENSPSRFLVAALRAAIASKHAERLQTCVRFGSRHVSSWWRLAWAQLGNEPKQALPERLGL